MNNIKRLLKARKGVMGIGTLIIFISIILVAAIAASVLLGTSGKLQQTALKTGEETRAGVATGVEIISISATNGSDGDIENLSVLMRLNPGSDVIKFNNTVIRFDTKDTQQDVNYDGEIGDTCALGATSSTYCVEYIKEGTDHVAHYLSKGDFVRVTFNMSTRSVEESETVRMRVIPRVGQATAVEFITPDTMKDQRVYLYP